MLQRSNNVVFGVKTPKAIVYDDRKSRPATQILSDRCSICAEKLKVETDGRRKNDLSPSTTDMYECVPVPDRFIAHFKAGSGDSEGVKYFK